MTDAGGHVSRPAIDQDVRFRILLFSDLHLDRPYAWAPPSLAEARRVASREALVEILGVARQHAVDVLACAGDLFDRRTVRPASMQWLTAAFRSAGVPVLIAPGNADYVGPLGGYTRHDWPDNVTIFSTDRLTPVEIGGGLTIWGAGHTEAHRARSFLDGFQVDREGVNLALFHGAERGGLDRQPDLDPVAAFDEVTIGQVGFDHALVGHFRGCYLGSLHTYPGAPLAHDFGVGSGGGAVLVTIRADGSIDREYLAIAPPELHSIEVDLTAADSAREMIGRAKAAVGHRSGVIRFNFTGRVSPELVVRRDDFIDLVASPDDLLLEWNADIDLDHLAEEQTIRGQFVRDVLGSTDLPHDRREQILLIGLRALAGSDVLEKPR